MSTKWKNKTRGGHPVRIYAQDCGGCWPIHGAIYRSGVWHLESWTSEGKYAITSRYRDRDLIPNTPIIDWSKQPDWCNAVAMDSDGAWCRYDVVPVCGSASWFSRDRACYRMHPSEYLAFDGDWKDSLCVRPEGGVK